MKRIATALALGLAVPAGAQTVAPAPTDQAAELMATYRDKIAVARPCPTGPGGEIVVCGRRSQQSRYRLPLRELAQDEDSDRIVPGELPRASAREIKHGSCGVVWMENPCNKGNNNIGKGANALMKLFNKLVDPEAEVEPLAEIPDRYRGAGR